MRSHQTKPVPPRDPRNKLPVPHGHRMLCQLKSNPFLLHFLQILLPVQRLPPPKRSLLPKEKQKLLSAIESSSVRSKTCLLFLLPPRLLLRLLQHLFLPHSCPMLKENPVTLHPLFLHLIVLVQSLLLQHPPKRSLLPKEKEKLLPTIKSSC